MNIQPLRLISTSILPSESIIIFEIPEALRVAARYAIMKEQIYCTGTLLDAVQRGHLFKDCKTFVDMPLKADAGEYFPPSNHGYYEKNKEKQKLISHFPWFI